MAEIIKAPKAHLWKSGQSGNPAGRPKGSKNAITLLKLQVEGELRQEMKGRLPKILKKAAEMAEEGDPQMIKMFMDMWVGKARSMDDEGAGKEKVQIVIGRLDQEPQVKGHVIEGNSNEVEV